MEMQKSLSSVVKNRGFLNLWLNQILVQLSYNSLNFALLVWVFRLTDSITAVSALLFAIHLPAVILGLFAGVLVDVTDRRKIIKVTNIFMALCFFSLLFLKFNYPAILVITFFINALSQFYMPAESSAIPLIVRKPQLLIANSIFSTTLYATFLVGFGLSGPLINSFGIDFIFGVGGMILIGAFLLSFIFPSIIGKANQQGKILMKAIKNRELKVINEVGKSEIRQTIDLIRGKLPVLSSISILAGLQMAIGVSAVLMPAFLERVLKISATDASYVLILPLGVGMVTGGLIVSSLSKIFPRRRIVGSAIVFGGLMFLVMGLAPLIAPVIKHFPSSRPLPFFYQLPISKILIAGSFLLGIALVSIIVPSQTVLQENTSEENRGKVFSVLGVTMATLSLLPVLISGIVADIFGAMPIFISLGIIIVLIGAFALRPSLFFAENKLPYSVREFLGLGHWKGGK